MTYRIYYCLWPILSIRSVWDERSSVQDKHSVLFSDSMWYDISVVSTRVVTGVC